MDISTAKGFALLTTHNRVKTNLPRFFNAAKASGMTMPGFVIVDEADYAAHVDDYDALELPDNWSVHLVRGGSCGEATEQAYKDLVEDDTDYVMWLTDDLYPVTSGWDAQLVGSLNGWNVVSCNDDADAPKKMNGAVVWSAGLLRAVGYLYPPGLKHFYVDTAWEELGRMMNVWNVRMDIMVKHLHHSRLPGATDKTTKHTETFWNEDERVFNRWKRYGRMEAANKIGELLIDYGASEKQPDLSHINIMIATPCGDGCYERLYQQSLKGTIDLLIHLKATVNFVELPYCSDIGLARSKIMGAFMRSDAEYMLSIDSDMGWNPSDVVRLIQHKRDFIAVAGPRKVFPPSFAVQNVGNNGQAIPLLVDGDGVAEVSDIGFAFALIKRCVFERVRDAHPELIFQVDGGPEESAVFNPMVVNGRYKSEDYSFCHRYRALGGKVYCDPGISLQHVGKFVWSGDWLTQLLANSKQERAAA